MSRQRMTETLACAGPLLAFHVAIEQYGYVVALLWLLFCIVGGWWVTR